MNHKRGRPKHQRMGCSCKYWKDERAPKSGDNLLASDRRQLPNEQDENITYAEASDEVTAEINERNRAADIEAMDWPFGVADGVIGWPEVW